MSRERSWGHDEGWGGSEAQSGSAPWPGRRTAVDFVQREASGDAAVAADAGSALDAAAGSSGSPLPDAFAARMGGAMGADLGGVRVHTGTDAATAASSIDARAYTVGQDIYFGAGEYQPGTPGGDRLLGHEVVHTVQQGSASSAGPQAKLEVSQPGDAAEVEADQIADSVLGGKQGCACGGGGCAECGGGAPTQTPTAIPRMKVSRALIQRDGTPGAAAAGAAAAGAAAGGAGAGAGGAAAAAGGAAAAGAAAAAPGACPDPAEQARKDAFRRRFDMHLDDNIPSTGIGKFDARYFPMAGLMPITLKIHFNFVQADNTPAFMERMRRLFRGDSNAQFFWTEAEKTQYKTDFVSRVQARWSAQHIMRAIKPCWTEFLAITIVTPVSVETAAGAHYDVTVHKSPGPGIDYNSVGHNENLVNPANQPTADFWQSDNTEESDFNSGKVATTERTRIETALTAAAASPVQFTDPSNVTVSPADRAKLLTFATQLNQANPSAPMIPIDIRGFASPEGDAGTNTTLATQRADAVAAVLRGASVRQPLRAVGGGTTGAANDAAARKAEITVDHAFETTYNANRYSVTEHEVGHMLGMPDEYSNATPGTLLGGMQARYDGLVTSAGLSVPTYGEDTSSQMSNGVDVLPRHYVTFWEALGRMTSPDLTQADWSIT